MSGGTRSYSIGIIRGDGIGPEVVAEGLKALDRCAALEGFSYVGVEYPWSSTLYLERGTLMPESMVDEYRALDAIFLGALGDPRVERGLIERSVIMTIRLGLDLYVNLRPVVLIDQRLTPLKGRTPAEIDMVFVRENTEDVYVGIGGRHRADTAEEVAVATMVFTRSAVERCTRYAFELARSRGGKRHVTLVDKANAIRPQEIWRRALAAVAREYPDVESDAIYVDAAAMYMVSNPARFDVVLTTNLFGDILTDLGAVITGGMGGAASGNIHPGRTSMFEPIHGSAPDIAGKGMANPIGAILAVGMMLEYLGERRGARRVERAVRRAVSSGRVRSFDATSGASTTEIGDAIVEELERDEDGDQAGNLSG